ALATPYAVVHRVRYPACTMRLLLVTPPMIQLNTPYPATAYLMGFLRLHAADLGLELTQADASLTLFLRLFSGPLLARAADVLGQRVQTAGKRGPVPPEPVHRRPRRCLAPRDRPTIRARARWRATRRKRHLVRTAARGADGRAHTRRHNARRAHARVNYAATRCRRRDRAVSRQC